MQAEQRNERQHQQSQRHHTAQQEAGGPGIAPQAQAQAARRVQDQQQAGQQGQQAGRQRRAGQSKGARHAGHTKQRTEDDRCANRHDEQPAQLAQINLTQPLSVQQQCQPGQQYADSRRQSDTGRKNPGPITTGQREIDLRQPQQTAQHGATGQPAHQRYALRGEGQADQQEAQRRQGLGCRASSWRIKPGQPTQQQQRGKDHEQLRTVPQKLLTKAG